MISSTETVTVHETSNGNVVKTSPDVAVGMVRLDATEEDAPGGRSKYGKLIDQYGNDFEVPEYTFKQIRDAIPPHCFERSALKGYRFVVQDLTLLTLTFLGFSKYLTPENVPSWSARFALWTLYTVLQGIFGIGVWVDAHECGHQAFSESRLINDVTGWVLHSFLLVPYFSWKLSHKQHHALHNNVAKDIQFVPKTRENYGEYHEKNIHSGWEFTEDTPLYTAATLIGQQLIGWPYYLLTNDSGTENYRNRPDGRGIGKHNGFGGGVNHYDPRSPLYSANEWHLILLSDLGLAITIGGVLYVGANYGWANVLVWYVIPYLWVNHWLGKL